MADGEEEERGIELISLEHFADMPVLENVFVVHRSCAQCVQFVHFWSDSACIEIQISSVLSTKAQQALHISPRIYTNALSQSRRSPTSLCASSAQRRRCPSASKTQSPHATRASRARLRPIRHCCIASTADEKRLSRQRRPLRLRSDRLLWPRMCERARVSADESLGTPNRGSRPRFGGDDTAALSSREATCSVAHYVGSMHPHPDDPPPTAGFGSALDVFVCVCPARCCDRRQNLGVHVQCFDPCPGWSCT